MKIGQTLTKDDAKIFYEQIEAKRKDIFKLKDMDDEIIERFNIKEKTYAVVKKLIDGELEVFELLRLTNLKDRKRNG